MEVMEILHALNVLLNWRFFLSVGLSIMVALYLSSHFEAFTAGYCVAFVILATGFGIVWQGRSEAGLGLLDKVPATPISKPVASLGLIFIGFWWGNLFSWLLGSEFLGALALVLSVILIGAWYRYILHRPATLGYLAFAGISLLSGMLVPLLIIRFSAT